MPALSRWSLACLLVMASLVAEPIKAFGTMLDCVGPVGTGFCQLNAGWCEVTQQVTIGPGEVVDCTGIDVRIKSSGVVLVNSGTFTLLARNLTIEQGRRIEAVPDPASVVGIEIALTGDLVLSGKLIAQNAGRGSYIAVDADGSIILNDSNPAIDVIGTENSSDGGEVYLSSGGDVLIGKRIYANGKDGGDDTNVNVGGLVSIVAVGNVDINEEIRIHGHWFGGGYMRVIAGGSISLNDVSNSTVYRGKISGEGRALSGYGGSVELSANGSVLIGGTISLPGGINNSGGESAGGELSLSAGCGGITIEDPIDLSGGEANGGVLVADAEGPVLLTSLIDARSRNYGGGGGVILISSGQLIEVADTAEINVNGHNTAYANEDGEGGLILLAACQVDIKDTTGTGPTLTATGAVGGAMSFEGSKSPLASNETSVRVGNLAEIDTTGETVQGLIFLEVAEQRFGRCSNNVNATCTLDSECVFGCGNLGTCTNPQPNPATDGVLTQFVPAPIVEQRSDLHPCSTVCP